MFRCWYHVVLRCCWWLAINLARAVYEAFSKILPAQLILFTAEWLAQDLVLVLVTRGLDYVACFDLPVDLLVVYAFTAAKRADPRAATDGTKWTLLLNHSAIGRRPKIIAFFPCSLSSCLNTCNHSYSAYQSPYAALENLHNSAAASWIDSFLFHPQKEIPFCFTEHKCSIYSSLFLQVSPRFSSWVANNTEPSNQS